MMSLSLQYSTAPSMGCMMESESSRVSAGSDADIICQMLEKRSGRSSRVPSGALKPEKLEMRCLRA